MSYMKFKEFVVLKELMAAPPAGPQVANNPAVKASVQQNLMAALKAPPPPGSNPVQYQGKIKAAMGISKVAPVPTASAAMDVAGASSKAAQP